MTLVFPGLSCSTFRFLSILFVCLFLLHWKQWLVLCVVSSHRNLDCIEEVFLVSIWPTHFEIFPYHIHAF